ncbi:MAG: hypothetical protein QXP59_03535 [Saccharolobus sp.]
MPKSIRDVKHFSLVLEEFDLRNCIIIDRGFFSVNNIDEMNKKEIRFIQPLRRNSKIIEYFIIMKESFVYRDRGIIYGMKRIGKYYLYLYDNVKMKGKEHSNLIENRSREKRVKIDESRLGKIAILSNMLRQGVKYTIYTSKGKRQSKCLM